ncbi:hypothetical protein [Actinoallomurus acanthiterrae]
MTTVDVEICSVLTTLEMPPIALVRAVISLRAPPTDREPVGGVTGQPVVGCVTEQAAAQG